MKNIQVVSFFLFLISGMSLMQTMLADVKADVILVATDEITIDNNRSRPDTGTPNILTTTMLTGTVETVDRNLGIIYLRDEQLSPRSILITDNVPIERRTDPVDISQIRPGDSIVVEIGPDIEVKRVKLR